MRPKPMDSTGETLSPQAAAAALSRLENYEERLTARAFGITMMAFGIAVPGITLTYAHATPWVELHELYWLFSFLWMPWILGAMLITAGVWRTQSITLGEKPDKRSDWMYGVGFSALYLLLLGAMAFLNSQMAWAVEPSVQNVVVLGVFTLIMAGVLQRAHGYSALLRPVFLIGFVLIAVGATLAALDVTGTGADLLSAAVGMTGYVGTGLYVYTRG